VRLAGSLRSTASVYYNSQSGQPYVRLFDGRPASATLWVNDVVYRKTLREQKREAPNPVSWARQLNRWRVFDNLIANIDRNEGNLLVLRSPDWHLVLIDHSRAFTNTTRMIFEMSQIDRPFYDKLKALDAKTLDAKIGKLVLDWSQSILRRRDMIVAQFEKLAKTNGEARSSPRRPEVRSPDLRLSWDPASAVLLSLLKTPYV
jgi:hypothetical protein